MKNLLNKLLGRQSVPKKEESKISATPVRSRKKNPKEIANEKNEPYVAIVKVELDPDNIGSGSFELDWNDQFLSRLVRAGYQLTPNESEDIIVDRWFQQICRNVIMENFEQEQADPDLRRATQRRDLGSGRTEIS